MPKRDRRHEIETESQRAFESALPASVVVRPISDDYGVDREVEVFVNGRTTGLTFKVQLKGTDGSGTKLRIKRSSLDYWRSLDVPTLLVSFESKTKTLRARWVHSIGFDGPDSGKQTITVHMDPALDLLSFTAETLANDLVMIRQVVRGAFPIPMPVQVGPTLDANLSAAQLSAAIQTLTGRTRNPMRPAKQGEAALAITLRGTRLQVAMPLRVASATVEMPTATFEAFGPRRLAGLALLLAAAATVELNAEIARSWLSAVSPSEPWWTIDELVEQLAPLLDHPDSADQLLAVYRQLALAGDPGIQSVSVPLMRRLGDVTSECFERETAALAEHVRAHPGTGRLAFNLASLYRLTGRFDRAVEMYGMAEIKSPRYAEDPFFLRLLGAVQWELGEFAASATTYQKALDRGFDAHELRPLLADSLMYDGRYEEARQVLTDWEAIGERSDKAGLLRRLMLDCIVENVGVASQDRTQYDQGTLEQSLQAATQDEPYDAEAIMELLRRDDALHPDAWFALIGLHEERISFEPALIHAFLLGGNPLAWVLALVGALGTDVDDEVVQAIVNQARSLASDSFYEAALEFAEQLDEPEADVLRELIGSTYATEPEKLDSRVRLIDEEAPDWVVDEVVFRS